MFQCFIDSWKQIHQTGGDDIPEAQEARSLFAFCPLYLKIFLIKCILAKVIKKEKGQSPRCQLARRWLRKEPDPASVFSGSSLGALATQTILPGHKGLYWPLHFLNSPMLWQLESCVKPGQYLSFLLCSLRGENERG